MYLFPHIQNILQKKRKTKQKTQPKQTQKKHRSRLNNKKGKDSNTYLVLKHIHALKGERHNMFFSFTNLDSSN